MTTETVCSGSAGPVPLSSGSGLVVVRGPVVGLVLDRIVDAQQPWPAPHPQTGGWVFVFVSAH